MTREQLIEMLWGKCSQKVGVVGPYYGNIFKRDIVEKGGFTEAINAALDAQARGCLKVARTETMETEYVFSQEKYANDILEADPEVTP